MSLAAGIVTISEHVVRGKIVATTERCGHRAATGVVNLDAMIFLL
jgi:hypothetical protein